MPFTRRNPTSSTVMLPDSQAYDAAIAVDTAGIFNVKEYGASPANTAAQNNTAFTSACAALVAAGGGELYIPPDGEYQYNGGLVLTVPCTLRGGGMRSRLNYTGTGIAIKFGPDGLVYATRHEQVYEITNLALTGGASMTAGVYWNTFLVTCRASRVFTEKLGNATGWAFHFNDENWSCIMIDCRGYADFADTKHWVRINAAGGVNSTLFKMVECQYNGYGGNSQGVYLNGARNEIAHSKIEGCNPCVTVTPLARGASLVDSYFESFNNGAIAYGPATGVGEVLQLKINTCYFNCHNIDLSYTGVPLYPLTVDSGLREFTWGDNNEVVELLSTRSPIAINTAVTGQTGNYYGATRGVGKAPPNPSGQSWASPSLGLFTNTAASTAVANTIVETAFDLAYAFSANDLLDRQSYRMTARGNLSTAASGTVTMRLQLKLGTVLLCDFGVVTMAISIAGRAWNAEATFQVWTSGATGTVEAQGEARLPTANNNTSASFAMAPSTATKTVDTTAAQTLTLTATHGAASAANTITMRQLIVERTS